MIAVNSLAYSVLSNGSSSGLEPTTIVDPSITLGFLYHPLYLADFPFGYFICMPDLSALGFSPPDWRMISEIR